MVYKRRRLKRRQRKKLNIFNTGKGTSSVFSCRHDKGTKGLIFRR